jgi:hypothetical protein
MVSSSKLIVLDRELPPPGQEVLLAACWDSTQDLDELNWLSPGELTPEFRPGSGSKRRSWVTISEPRATAHNHVWIPAWINKHSWSGLDSIRVLELALLGPWVNLASLAPYQTYESLSHWSASALNLDASPIQLGCLNSGARLLIHIDTAIQNWGQLCKDRTFGTIVCSNWLTTWVKVLLIDCFDFGKRHPIWKSNGLWL